MSDEEKKAVEELIARREYFEYNQEGCNHHLSFDKWETEEIIDTILNFIEKQSKEIEELKNADLTTVYLNGFYDGEKKVKDKIKAKIELVKSLKENIYYEENVIEILQSLLEKE